MTDTPDASAGTPYRPRLAEIMGPGLITGASDDDPSGIATYSQVGAQFGFGLSWVVVFSYPLMAAIQEISARIGRVTGYGIAGNLRRHGSASLLRFIVALLVVANLINLGADLGAMAAALELLIPGPVMVYVVGFGVLSGALPIVMRYSRYVAVLKWLCLSLFSYVICAFVVRVPWGQVALSIVWPHITLSSDYLMAVVALLGTTISPYLFFWQAEQEVEDEKQHPGARPLLRAPQQAAHELLRIRLDTYLGMAISNLIALFIVITTAATLNAQGVTDIQTSAQAAEALRDVAGRFTFVVFAAGIIGTGMLAMPVLAGSAAYAVGETLGWHVGLARRLVRARAFYGAIAGAMVVGIVMNVSGVDPIRALYWSAVVNGIVSIPVMVAMMRLSVRADVMGPYTLPRPLKWMGWLATGVVSATVLAMFAAWLL